MQYLTAPHSLPKARSLERWRFLLRLWHYPSFDASRAWGIYRLTERGGRMIRTMVRQVTWDGPHDAKRFYLPLTGLEKGFHTAPTIDVRDRPIDSTEFDHRMEALKSISFPAFSATDIGIDGEYFGVAIPNHGASIKWWCEGPNTWRDLTAWASQTREWLTDIALSPPRNELWLPPRPRLP